MGVSRRHELGSFLRTKRAQVDVADTVLGYGGAHRRVPGLRREEVAELAHISLTYYTKLERGKVPSISSMVLDGLVDALRLTNDERAYVASLIPISGELGRLVAHADLGEQAEAVRLLLDQLTASPAYVLDVACNIIAINALGRRLYSEALEEPAGGNTLRYIFLDPRSRDFYADWSVAANEGVQYLRASRARYPQDTSADALIHELHDASETFREAWHTHQVQFQGAGTRGYHHGELGDLELGFLNLELPDRPGIRLTVYTAEPGSPTAARLASR